MNDFEREQLEKEKAKAIEPDNVQPVNNFGGNGSNQTAQSNPQPNAYGQQNTYRQAYSNQQQNPNYYSRPYNNTYTTGQFNNSQQVYTTPPTQSPKKKSKVAPVLGAIIAVCVALAMIVVIMTSLSGKTSNGTSSTAPQSNDSGLQLNESPSVNEKKDGSDELTIAGVVKKVEESCVTITVKTTKNVGSYYGNLGESTSVGEGSGVLMLENKEQGLTYVVTCAHVISEANSTFTVKLSNGTEHEAQLVGYDSQTDIGVLSINATNLKLAEFGDSSALVKGQTVVAIGNPGGIGNSVTDGIVSAINRPVASSIGYKTECIQHSAPINPGNSGGGLFNTFGQVVGINSSKIAETDYEGMGFAVPSKTVQEVVNSIIANGYVVGRAQLGITYNSLSQYNNYAQLVAAGLPKGSIVINSINQESVFTGTKVQPYDVITAVDGKALDSVDVLTSALGAKKPGEQMTLSMARIKNGKIEKFDVTVTLIEAKN